MASLHLVPPGGGSLHGNSRPGAVMGIGFMWGTG
jgi:hypothetical protein